MLPQDVDLRADAEGDDVVTTSLFGREGNDVVVDWQGLTVRARASGYRPRVDERVRVTVRRGLVFPSEGVRSAQRVLA